MVQLEIKKDDKGYYFKDPLLKKNQYLKELTIEGACKIGITSIDLYDSRGGYISG